MVLPRFLAELKHRNIYRAAVVYAAVGWMLLEAADVVLPRLGLPDWTVNFVFRSFESPNRPISQITRCETRGWRVGVSLATKSSILHNRE